jgi:hypothetical protein
MATERTIPQKGLARQAAAVLRGDQGDGPDKPSPDWQAMAPFWETAQDLIDGLEVLREKTTRYLPRFPNESAADYRFRCETSKFTNIYRDIIEGLSQKPFAKELSLPDDTPPRILEMKEDIDGRGNHLHTFASETFFHGINKGLHWILVDYAKAEGLRTVEDEARAGVRPYWVQIPAEKVIWVESEVMQGREQLTLVRIKETKDTIREFSRVGGRVTWMIYRRETQEGGKEIWLLEDEGAITIGVIPLVPFTAGRRKGNTWQFNLPMKDAADLQIEHYQQETNLKHVKSSAAFPMLAGNGVEPDMDGDKPRRVPIGPHGVLYAPPNSNGQHGNWEWIEPNANTLKFLAEDVKETAKELREIGRQPLTAQSANMTVIGTAFAAAKGNSAVQQWALELKDALENALKLTAMWIGESIEPEVTIFTEFGVEDSGPEVPRLLLELRTAEPPQISQQTLWEEYKRRGMLSAEFNHDREIERLLQEFGEGEF